MRNACVSLVTNPARVAMDLEAWSAVHADITSASTRCALLPSSHCSKAPVARMHAALARIGTVLHATVATRPVRRVRAAHLLRTAPTQRRKRHSRPQTVPWERHGKRACAASSAQIISISTASNVRRATSAVCVALDRGQRSVRRATPTSLESLPCTRGNVFSSAQRECIATQRRDAVNAQAHAQLVLDLAPTTASRAQRRHR